jgi:hypothetical protein
MAQYPENWTVDAQTGASNSSAEFIKLVTEVEQIIRNGAHALINGQVNAVAGVIVATLAHKYGMAPSRRR